MVRHLVAIACVAALVLLLSGCAVSSGQNPRSSSPARDTSPLDLNVATASQLQQLPGITAAYARRIIANRPYKVKHELETRKILPRAVYARIRDRVIAIEPNSQSVSRLQIPRACKFGV